MRVIFLDIDGVLNNRASSSLWTVRLPRANMPGKTTPVPSFHADCVARFNRLVEQTGAVVVISSTWGRVFDFSAVKRYLEDEGVCCDVIDKTPVYMTCRPRGREIQQWLDDWQGEPIESFCILDDHDDMQHLKGRLVQMRDNLGLQDRDVEAAIRLLTS